MIRNSDARAILFLLYTYSLRLYGDEDQAFYLMSSRGMWKHVVMLMYFPQFF